MNTSTDRNSNSDLNYRPTLSNAGLDPTFETQATDEIGNLRRLNIAEERPLTIFIDDREIVTLMTLGLLPEILTLGYLRNQGLVNCLETIESVHVDWTKDRADVTTVSNSSRHDLSSFQKTISNISPLLSNKNRLSYQTIYELLRNLSTANNVYRTAGGVHGCAICQNAQILFFIVTLATLALAQ